MLFRGAKGYVSLSEDQARDALGERHSIDEFLERFEKRPEAEDYANFVKNLCGHRNALDKRFAVIRTFERQAPLLVGVAIVANGEKVTSAVYGSPAVAHKNAGKEAMARLRGQMLGESLLRGPRHIAMLNGQAGPRKADQTALAREHALSFNLAEIPPEIRGEALRMLQGAPHAVAHLDTRRAPRVPSSEAKSWRAEIAPALKFTSPAGPMELVLPIRFGQRTERGYAGRDLINFQDDVDVVDIEDGVAEEDALAIGAKG